MKNMLLLAALTATTLVSGHAQAGLAEGGLPTPAFECSELNGDGWSMSGLHVRIEEKDHDVVQVTITLGDDNRWGNAGPFEADSGNSSGNSNDNGWGNGPFPPSPKPQPAKVLLKTTHVDVATKSNGFGGVSRLDVTSSNQSLNLEIHLVLDPDMSGSQRWTGQLTSALPGHENVLLRCTRF